MMATTYVYLISDPKSNAVKIGRSDNPMKRVGELQTGNPNPLSLLSCFAAEPSVEQTIHKHLEKYSLNGEWFADCDEVMDIYYTYLTNCRYKPQELFDEAIALLQESRKANEVLVALCEKQQEGWEKFVDDVDKQNSKLKSDLKQRGVDI